MLRKARNDEGWQLGAVLDFARTIRLLLTGSSLDSPIKSGNDEEPDAVWDLVIGIYLDFEICDLEFNRGSVLVLRPSRRRMGLALAVKRLASCVVRAFQVLTLNSQQL